MSPWVRRALQGNLPVAISGGAAANDDVVGITPAPFGSDAWSARSGRRDAVPIEIGETNPVCVCGEVHPGWQHREAPER